MMKKYVIKDTELHDPEKLKRHMKKAHGNVPAKKPNADGDGGLW